MESQWTERNKRKHNYKTLYVRIEQIEVLKLTRRGGRERRFGSAISIGNIFRA
jgi:hypothetical protein